MLERLKTAESFVYDIVNDWRTQWRQLVFWFSCAAILETRPRAMLTGKTEQFVGGVAAISSDFPTSLICG